MKIEFEIKGKVSSDTVAYDHGQYPESGLYETDLNYYFVNKKVGTVRSMDKETIDLCTNTKVEEGKNNEGVVSE